MWQHCTHIFHSCTTVGMCDDCTLSTSMSLILLQVYS